MESWDVDAWLGAKFQGVVLTEGMQESMKAAYEAGRWSQVDVPDKDVDVDDELIGLWKVLLNEGRGDKGEEDESDESELARLSLWFKRQYRPNKDVIGRDVKGVITPTSAGATARGRVGGAGEEEVEPVKEFEEMGEEEAKFVIPADMRKVMMEHGASRPYDLASLEYAVRTGRVPTGAEMKGYSWAGSSLNMAGYHMLSKRAPDNMIQKKLESAKNGGSIDELDSHFSRVSTQLSASKSRPYAPVASAELMRSWLAIKRALKAPPAIAAYLIEVMGDNEGKGFPFKVDMEIAMRVRIDDKMGLSPAVGAAGTGGGGGTAPAGDLKTAIAAQLGEITTVVERIDSSVSSLASRLRRVESRIETKCHHCGMYGHLKADCPELNKDGKGKPDKP